MDTTGYTKKGSPFLKAEIVSKSPNVLYEIVGEAMVVKNQKFNTERLHIPVRNGNEEYTFDCSSTNARVISESVGAESKKWIGKLLKLSIYRTKTKEGKMVDAINVDLVK